MTSALVIVRETTFQSVQMCLWRLWEQCPWCNTKLWPLSLDKTDTKADANVLYVWTAFQIQTTKLHKCKPAGLISDVETLMLGWQTRLVNSHQCITTRKCCSWSFCAQHLWCSKAKQTRNNDTQQTSSVCTGLSGNVMKWKPFCCCLNIVSIE